MNTPRQIKEAFEAMTGKWADRVKALAQTNDATPRQIATCLAYQGIQIGETEQEESA